jgi:hypothetical protein
MVETNSFPSGSGDQRVKPVRSVVTTRAPHIQHAAILDEWPNEGKTVEMGARTPPPRL